MHHDPVVTGQFIYQIGESDALRLVSSPVKHITSQETQRKIAYVKKCMHDYRRLTEKGRAIAAVQVGIPERLFVMYMPEEKQELFVAINPIITKKSKTFLRYPEMCMSANSLIASVVKPAWVEFTYYDEAGKEKTWMRKDDDLLGTMYNRVVQHEMDHFEGIINIDLVPSKELIFLSDPSFYDTATFEKA